MTEKPTYEELEQRVKKQAEQLNALNQDRERTNYLESAVKQSFDGLAVTDLDGNIIELNEAFAKMHGYSADELKGKNLSIFHTAEQMPSVNEANWYLKEHGEFTGEIWHARRDGTVFPALMHNSLFYNNSGNLIGMIGSCKDITERKRAGEELLRLSAQSFSTLADNAYDGIVIVNADGRHIYANKRAAEITGYSVAELLEVNIRQLAHPGEIPIWKDRLKRRISGEEFAGQYRTEIFTKAGALVPVEIASSRTIWHGQPAGLTIIRDITERKRVEEALRQSEIKLRSLIDTTSDWVWEVDLNGYFTYASPRAKVLLGYDADEIVGLNLVDLLADEEVEPNRVNFKRRCENPEPFKGRKTTLIRKDGQRVIVEISGTPVYDKDGKFLGYFGCDKDITEKVLAEDVLRKSEKEYRNLFESFPEPVGIVLSDFNALVNPAFFRLFGYSSKDLENDTVGTLGLLKNDEDKKIARKRIERRLSGKKVTPEFHYVDLVSKEGQTIPCEVNNVIIQYDGRPASLVCFRDISERKQAELDLKERQAELDLKNKALEEMNSALRFLLKKRDEDKIDLEQDVLFNIQKLVIPYLDKLTKGNLDAKLASYVSILKSNLNDIVSPFSRRVTSDNLKLTRAEIQVSNLIKQGMDTKEIAELLNLSITTIETHRRNIRKKFGLKNRRQNLRTHLSELSNE